MTASHTAIYAALVDARPEREVWTWTGQNQNVEWVRRRMAQETAVHRWDAAHAVGQPDDIDALVAADGIDEFLTYFTDAEGVDGDLGGTVHLHCTDTPGEWFISSLTSDGIAFTREHTKGDVAIRGKASDLLLWLWRRDAGPVDIVGDAELGARFRQRVRPRTDRRVENVRPGLSPGGRSQPPIWLIDLPGRMKLTWLIRWPAHFLATAASMRAAISSSD